MRQIKVIMVRPNLGTDKNISHILTTYEVSIALEFTDETVVLRGQLESSRLSTDTQTETIYLNIEDPRVTKDTPLFFRYKHHFQRIGSDKILEAFPGVAAPAAASACRFVFFTPSPDSGAEKQGSLGLETKAGPLGGWPRSKRTVSSWSRETFC